MRKYLEQVLHPTEKEEMFWDEFSEGRYYPELVFEDYAIQKRWRSHPMVIWKCEKNKR